MRKHLPIHPTPCEFLFSMFGLLAIAAVTSAAFAPAPSVLDREMAASVMVSDAGGHGSGVAIGPRLVLTADHIVADGGDFKVKTADGAEYAAEVMWQSPSRDVALLQLEEKASLPHADLACRKPELREPVTVIGSPLGARFVVTQGNVASLHQIDDKDYDPTDVTLDVSMAWGNSGGPVFDENGNVLGLADKVFLREIGMGVTLIPLGVMVPSWRICELLGKPVS